MTVITISGNANRRTRVMASSSTRLCGDSSKSHTVQLPRTISTGQVDARRT